MFTHEAKLGNESRDSHPDPRDRETLWHVTLSCLSATVVDDVHSLVHTTNI